jgi:hypothetical protein
VDRRPLRPEGHATAIDTALAQKRQNASRILKMPNSSM